MEAMEALQKRLEALEQQTQELNHHTQASRTTPAMVEFSAWRTSLDPSEPIRKLKLKIDSFFVLSLTPMPEGQLIKDAPTKADNANVGDVKLLRLALHTMRGFLIRGITARRPRSLHQPPSPASLIAEN
jgi:hypothetical protein